MRSLFAAGLIGLACKPALSRDAAIADCKVAKPAYGGDLAACLTVRHGWTATDASLEASSEQAREIQLSRYLELDRSARPRAYADTRKRLIALGMAPRIADSIVAADSTWIARTDSLLSPP
jgi:hypothetical protein